MTTITPKDTHIAPLSALPPWRWGHVHTFDVTHTVTDWELARHLAVWSAQTHAKTPRKGFRMGTSPPLSAWRASMPPDKLQEHMQRHVLEATWPTACKDFLLPPVGSPMAGKFLYLRGVVALSAPDIIQGQPWTYTATAEAAPRPTTAPWPTPTLEEMAIAILQDEEAAKAAGLA